MRRLRRTRRRRSRRIRESEEADDVVAYIMSYLDSNKTGGVPDARDVGNAIEDVLIRPRYTSGPEGNETSNFDIDDSAYPVELEAEFTSDLLASDAEHAVEGSLLNFHIRSQAEVTPFSRGDLEFDTTGRILQATVYRPSQGGNVVGYDIKSGRDPVKVHVELSDNSAAATAQELEDELLSSVGVHREQVRSSVLDDSSFEIQVYSALDTFSESRSPNPPRRLARSRRARRNNRTKRRRSHRRRGGRR